jgi:hypothetical protein
VENGISGSRNLGWDLEEVRFMKSTMPDATSFDRPASYTESGWFADSIEDVEASDTPDVVTQEIEVEQLRRAVEDLPGRERCAPTRGYGPAGCEQPPSPGSGRSWVAPMTDPQAPVTNRETTQANRERAVRRRCGGIGPLSAFKEKEISRGKA